jgi:maltooligosyltrehalose trehalohydrolase
MTAPAAAAVWTLERGARLLDDGRTRFTVWAPNVKRVSLVLGDGRDATEHPMEAHGGGVHELTLDGAGAGTDYRYRLDGRDTVPDPVSRWQPAGVHGPSRVVDPHAFPWTDAGWGGLPMADLVIYELHVGTFSEEGTFDGVIPHLARLRALGVTALEIMPVAEFPGSRNWGYDGVHPYAPQSTYGGPDGLRRLVDAAHDAGLAVILDVVYNHLGPEGNYLNAFGPYFTDKYRTPWGNALNYDDAGSDEVRRYFIDNALYWVTEFHLDGLRLDAVHAIYDFGATHVLQELATSVHAVGEQMGRKIVLIAESDMNDPKVVRPAAQAGWGMDAQWADDLHHAVHAVLSGERTGYYVDFEGISAIARALETPFVYDGRYSAHRRRRHGAPATGVSNEHFVVCVQNHDQVGNRATGDRLSTVLPFPARKLAAALYLLSPYVPMVFMGEEYGETNPFQYFVSHGDKELVDAVRKGRRREFAAFGWGEEVPDPQSEDTFLASKLEHGKRERGEHASLYALYGALLSLRTEEPALHPGDAEARVAYDEEKGWISLELVPRAGGRGLLVLFNLTGRAVEVSAGPTHAGAWVVLLSTEDPDFGGTTGRHPALSLSPDGSSAVRLAPWEAVLCRRE